jgi:hypothetical protein
MAERAMGLVIRTVPPSQSSAGTPPSPRRVSFPALEIRQRSLLGGVLSLTNLLYRAEGRLGLRRRHHACILSYAIWTTLHRVGVVGTPMTILENNCMQSTASSAGDSTGGMLIPQIQWVRYHTVDTPRGVGILFEPVTGE